ncbi:hypothetical protein GCM10023115_09050 [Pontixanthobacter gangjinensis]|nr:serine protease [Pontixanthobacter gangjinensis]
MAASSIPGRAQDDVAAQDLVVPVPKTGIVRVRLASDIGNETAAIRTALARHDGWEIAEPADYEIIRDPEFYPDIVLVPIKREGRGIAPAYDERFHRAGTMEVTEVLGYFADLVNQQYGWASNVPEPIYLGSPDEPDFDERFDSFAGPIASRASLLDLESKSDNQSTTVCVSLEAPPAGYCSFPSARGLMEVPRGANITVTVKQSWALDRNVHTLALAPDNSVSLLFSSEALQPSLAISEDFSSEAIIDNGSAPVIFNQLGLYRIITIASEHPLNPLIFSHDTRVAIPPSLCQNSLERLLCKSLFGNAIEQSEQAYLGATDVAVTDVYSTEPIRPTAYIINGFPVSRRDGLWQVQLFRPVRGTPMGRSGKRQGNAHRMNFEKAHHCGGSYIGDGFIVTAAHCVRNEPLGNAKPDMFVRMGTLDIASGGVTFGIDSIVVHSGYRKTPDYDDIALVRINPDQMGAVESLVSQGKLAPIDYRAASVSRGSKLLVTGWGFTGRTRDNDILDINDNTQRSPRYLEGAELTSQSNSRCSQVTTYSGYSLTNIVCASSPGAFKDACYKDSGGPLTRRRGDGRVLVGIVSAGNGCAITRGAPGIYTAVLPYQSWIDRAKAGTRRNSRVFVR